MEHYQERYTCGVCKRELVVDILSFGTGHQTIQAVTCLECGIKVGGTILAPGEHEDLEKTLSNSSTQQNTDRP
jgi:DNA-directed RNA polymerase subunit RPC12/RpoP